MIQQALHKVVDGKDLSEPEMMDAMSRVMDGEADPALLAAFLTALRMKGECAAEILGAARVMRARAEKISVAAYPVLDTCGTGGDGGRTFNISTAAAFVAAGAGVTVAKHGNRAVSGKSGSADVLKCLGVNIEAERSAVERCLAEAGIGFLFAPALHPAMKHAANVRKLLGMRTLFNLLGPLTNPAGAHAQIVGVFHARWVRPVAEALQGLGVERALVVHGDDGLDEISLAAMTSVAELRGKKILEYKVSPEQFGLQICPAADLQGGSPEENAACVRAILGGDKGPKRDVVVLNAAAGVYVAGKAPSVVAACAAAAHAIDSGAALDRLERLCKISNGRF